MTKNIFLILILVSFKLYAQTYSAPILTCVQNAGNKNELTWRLPSVSCGAFEKYYIFHATSKNGPFTIIDSILNSSITFYTHTSINSNLPHYYFMTSQYNCPGLISSKSDTIVDSTMPSPELISISIENGKPFYRWKPIIDKKNLWAYIAFTLGNKIIDSIKGRFSDSYSDPNFNVSSGVYQGGIATMDSCGGIKGTSGFGFQQRTCFLNLLNDPCEGVMRLDWTKYQGWSKNDTLKEYQILIKKNSQPEKIVAINDPNARNFIYTDLVYGDTICVRIKAINLLDPTIYSYSNQRCMVSTNANIPNSLQVLSPSYVNNYITTVKWYCDPASRAKNFRFKLVNTKSGETIKEITAKYILNDGKGFYQFNDSLAFPNGQSTYNIIFEDSCNKDTKGISGNTLFLNTTQVGLYSNLLTWNNILFPDTVAYTISSYDIYMSYENGSLNKITSLSGTETSYKHLVENLIETEGVFCYKIIAYFKFDTSTHLKDKPFEISSQLACLPMRSVIFIPNAFKVNGVTPSFKPKFVFWKGEYFNMQIFNRWGTMIYTTNDANFGWDGSTIQGALAPEDTYTYLISYKGNDGKIVNRTGNVTLFR